VILLLIVQELRVLEHLTSEGLAAALVVDHDGHQALAIGVGKRVYEHVVDHTEDGGGGSDA
jgi:hypothetical protein